MPMKIWFILSITHFRLNFFFSSSNHLIPRVIRDAGLPQM
jgi:hypothetical protein